jgi:phage head maturation protease
MNELIERAAAERAAQVVTRADRPAQRRLTEIPGLVTSGRTAPVSARLEVRAAGKPGTYTFNGVASAYEQGYEMYDMFGPYTEIVTAGAAEDLTRSDLDVPLVLAHDALRVMASTHNGSLALSQDDTALIADAPELDGRDGDVAYIAPKIESGLVREMSFKFLITKGQWSPDYTEYRINGFRIHRGDVAIVGFGANPHTSLGFRSATERAASTLTDVSEDDMTLLLMALGGDADHELAAKALGALERVPADGLLALERAVRAETGRRGTTSTMSRLELELLAAG